MTIGFQCSRGPALDAAELQYVAALLQSCSTTVRRDGTVRAVDVQRYLLSRHGLSLSSVAHIETEILENLAGSLPRVAGGGGKSSHGNSSNDVPMKTSAHPSNGYSDDTEDIVVDDMNLELFGSEFDIFDTDKDPLSMDMVQIFALLLIPELIRIRLDGSLPSAQEETDSKHDGEEESKADKTEWFDSRSSILDDKVNLPEVEENEIDDDDDDPSGEKAASEATADDEIEYRPGGFQVFLNKIFGKHDTKCDVEIVLEEEKESVEETRPQQSAENEAGQAVSHDGRNENGEENHIPDSDVHSSSSNGAMNVIRVVLNSLLNGSHTEYGSGLTAERLQKILRLHGEVWPDAIVEEMVDACRNPGAQDVEIPLVLDEYAFLRGLTADVQQLYDVSREDYLTSHYQDALDKPGQAIDRIYTASSCDSTADTYRSFWWNVLAWGTLVAVFFAYFVRGFGGVVRSLPGIDCANAQISIFGCHVVEGIVIWLEIFLELSLLGTIFLFFSTWGNSIYAFLESRLYAAFTDVVGIVVVFFATVLAYVYETDTALFSTTKEEDQNSKSRYWYALILGSLLLATQIMQLVRLFVPLNPQLAAYMVPGGLVRERWVKQSARYKVHRMLEKAIACHSSALPPEEKSPDLYTMSTSLVRDEMPIPLARILLNYQTRSDEMKQLGGIWWAWKHILDGDVMRKEGIWISPSLVSSHIAQWLVCLAIPIIFAYAASQIDDWNIFDPEITDKEITFGMGVGALVALTTSISTTLVFMPSAVSQTLQFRAGVIGSLKDPMFQAYRIGPDRTAILFGSCFWGIFFMAAVTWGFIGAVATFLVAHTFRDLVISIVSALIGIFTTILLKSLILMCLRTHFYAGLYRQKPAAANIATLVLECWNLGLSSGYIITRTAKLVLLTLLYLARIDTPFLAPGVGWASTRMPLDQYPIEFRKSLLLHEAHRHPYIERLGLLYMLKLRHGQRFGSRAGAAWRILFVLALAPWMQKHRRRGQTSGEGRSSSLSLMEHPTMTGLQQKNSSLEMENEALRQKNQELRDLLRVALAGHGNAPSDRKLLLRRSIRSVATNIQSS